MRRTDWLDVDAGADGGGAVGRVGDTVVASILNRVDAPFVVVVVVVVVVVIIGGGGLACNVRRPESTALMNSWRCSIAPIVTDACGGGARGRLRWICLTFLKSSSAAAIVS